MNDDWQLLPRAPAPGTTVCALAALQPGAPHFADMDGFALLILEDARGLRAFVNACPHQFLPLNYRGDSVVSADGARLRCSNHSAEFDSVSGEGCAGVARGCALAPVPVTVQGDRIVIG